jgi:hypothetical protein
MGAHTRNQLAISLARLMMEQIMRQKGETEAKGLLKT